MQVSVMDDDDDHDDVVSVITQPILTNEQIQEFVEQGVLVVDDILTTDEVNDALVGLSETLSRYGVDTHDLEGTGYALSRLSSTHGSGGVLDLFYDDWKMTIASHPRLFAATTQLWGAAYCHEGETKADLSQDDMFKWHPYGSFELNRGFMYVDRVGYRLPTMLADKLAVAAAVGGGGCGTNHNLLDCDDDPPPPPLPASRKKMKKHKSLQRSLTPHLDCCPETFFSEYKTKWRPIQCFVSLTTNLHPNTGGFEAVPGFHHEFEAWASHRPPSIVISKPIHGSLRETTHVPAPCVGEYTHIRPMEDASIMKRVRHIPVRAGSAVFWDTRIPHANAYRNDADQPRAVVYCSFLPNVAINRPYVDNQRHKFLHNINPTDQWIHDNEGDETVEPCQMRDCSTNLSPLGRKLLRIDMW